MSDDRIRITHEGTTAYLTLTRADKHNGVDHAMLKAMVEAQRSLRKMTEVRAVILHGDGPSFCSGLDFKTVLGEPLTAAAMVAELWLPYRNLFQDWSMGFRDLGVPVIAAVHGNCFGAGIQLALGADVRYCTADAKIAILEAKWGLVPDMGGATLLRDILSLDVAKELTMTGRILSGTEAKALGLVTHLAENPLEAARTLAAEIATRSPDSVAAAKFLLQDAYDANEDGALTAERRWQRKLLGFKNQRVAIEANQKKASPAFRARRIKR